MKLICILLDGEIKFDQRVIKTIRSLSVDHKIHLYYIQGTEKDKDLFNENVSLFSISKPNSLMNKVISHSWFVYEYNFFIDAVINTGNKYDIVWANDLPNLFPAWKIARKLNAKLVFDSHEIFVETLNQYFPRKRNFIHNILLKTMKLAGNQMENKLSSEIDLFVTVNDSLKNYFEKRYQLKQPAKVLMNLPNRLELDKIESFNFRESYNWDEQSVIFLFQGTLNQGRGLHLLVEAFGGIQDNRAKLVVIGDGPLKSELDAYITDHDLSQDIKLLGRIPSTELATYTLGADIGINLLEEINLSKKFTTATKMFEYFQCNLPVLCSNTAENQNILHQFEAGVLVKNNLTDLRKGILKMLDSQDLESYKRECKNAAEKLNWESQKSIIDEIIN